MTGRNCLAIGDETTPSITWSAPAASNRNPVPHRTPQDPDLHSQDRDLRYSRNSDSHPQHSQPNLHEPDLNLHEPDLYLHDLQPLESGQQLLLLPRVVAGLSAEDTGYVLGMSPGAVRWPSTGR